MQEVSILLIPEFSNLTFASIIEPLRVANRLADTKKYNWTLYSLDGKPPKSSSELSYDVVGSFYDLKKSDSVFIVASHNVELFYSDKLFNHLRSLARTDTCFGGFETGSQLLAGSGLLDGKNATVHWEVLENFIDTFPRVNSLSDRFVIDGRYYTASGASSSMDLILALIHQTHGLQLAIDVASRFLYSQSQEASEAQVQISFFNKNIQDPILVHAIRLMEKHIEEPLPIETIALKVGANIRNLQRIFKDALHCSPIEYYQKIRLEFGHRMLDRDYLNILEIAILCGFSSGSTFTRAYRQYFGKTPTQARKKIKFQ